MQKKKDKVKKPTKDKIDFHEEVGAITWREKVIFELPFLRFS